MKYDYEIRWHGRGGQGAKQAGYNLCRVLIEAGWFFQGIPEFGPERRGAPVVSYNRISKKPIYDHSGIKEPNIVVVLDSGLPWKNILEGLKPEGTLLVNTKYNAETLAERLKQEGIDLGARKVYTVDASSFSEKYLKRDLPNTSMIAALIKVTNLMKFEDFLENIKHELSKKYKPEVVEGNLNAIKEAYNSLN